MATTMQGRDAEEEEFEKTQNNIKQSNFDITEASMENDVCLLASCQREYHRDRKISIKNIPVTTSEEVDLFLGEYKLKDIKINKDTKEAEVTLECGEDAEDIVKERNQSKMLDHVINVAVLPSDKLMCLAHLPTDIKEEDFTSMVSRHGPVYKSYLIRAEDNGKSKGYGIVEYSLALDKHKQIRNALDWKEIRGHKIHCDILDPTTAASFSNLHSKCLLIDNLPKDYKDNVNFREVFSHHVSPIYCQIVMKEGDPLGYGIVEYSEGLDAEKSQRSLNGYEINGVRLRVTFCIPGKPAVAICTRILTKMEQKAASIKPSLLPDPINPSTIVVNHPLIRDLCAQHPNLMMNFKTALLQLQQTYVSQMNAKSTKPGLLGPAPSVNLNPLMNPNMQLGLAILLALQMQARSSNQAVGPSNLLTLIGQRFTSQMSNEKPSLLGDPVTAQANIILQNLMSQVPSGGDGYSSDDSSSDSSDFESGTPLLQSVALNIQNLNLNWLTSLGQLTNSMHENSSQFNFQHNNTSKNGQSGIGNLTPLLGGQMSGIGGQLPGSEAGMFGSGGRRMSENESRFSNKGDRGLIRDREAILGEGLLGAVPKFNDGNTSQKFMKNLQMLASSRGQKSELTSLLEKIPAHEAGKAGTSLLGDPPVGIMEKWKNLKDKLENGPDYVSPNSQHGGSSLFPNHGHPPSGSYKDSRSSRQYGGYSDQYQGYDEYSTYHDDSGYSRDDVSYDDSAYESFNRGHGSSSSMYDYDQYSYPHQNSSYVSQNTSNYSHSNVSNRGTYDQRYNSYNQYRESTGREPDRYQYMTAKAMAYAATNTHTYSNNYSGDYSGSYSSNYSNNSGNYSTPMPATQQPSYQQSSGHQTPSRGLPPALPLKQAPSPGGTALLKTPIGQKRSYSSLLPPPEPSPETDYVGQHSQGIGGHYAENYAHKRQKLDHGSLMSRYADKY